MPLIHLKNLISVASNSNLAIFVVIQVSVLLGRAIAQAVSRRLPT
jgi:hypothetical protein